MTPFDLSGRGMEADRAAVGEQAARCAADARAKLPTKTTLPALVEGPRLADGVAADRGFFVRAIIDLIEASGAKAHIPGQTNVRVRRVADLAVCRQRNLVERFSNKLKHFRGSCPQRGD